MTPRPRAMKVTAVAQPSAGEHEELPGLKDRSDALRLESRQSRFRSSSSRRSSSFASCGSTGV